MAHLLAKLSRKFAEKNSYTKLKAMMVLNTLAQNPNRDLVESLSSALEKLRGSARDDKTGREFFALQGIEEVAALASTAAELEAVHLARLYTPYVFDLIHAKSSMHALNTTNDTEVAVRGKDPSLEEYTDELVHLLIRSEEVSVSASHPATPLNAQRKSIVTLDQKWIVSELQRVHGKETSVLDARLRRVPDRKRLLNEAGFVFTGDQDPSAVFSVTNNLPKGVAAERVASTGSATHQTASVRKAAKTARSVGPTAEHVAGKSHKSSSRGSTAHRSTGININIFEASSAPARTIGTSSVPPAPAQPAPATHKAPTSAAPTTSSATRAADLSTSKPATAKEKSAGRAAGVTAPVPASQVRLASAPTAKKITPASTKPPPVVTNPGAVAKPAPRATSAADVATSKLNASDMKPPPTSTGATATRAKPGPSLAGKILSTQGKNKAPPKNTTDK